MNRPQPIPITGARAVQPASLRRGYFLIEVMLVLGILGVFAIVASKLLITSMNASIYAQHRAETAERFDLAMSQLRADVWPAKNIDADGLTTTLLQPDGSKVIWRIEPAAPFATEPTAPNSGRMVNLSRHAEPADGKAAAPSNDTRWNDLPPGMAFTAAGPTLRVRTPTASPSADSADSLTMISQLQLQGRMP
jgi:type II secretory pathway pseudopilin PulG